MTRRTIAAPVTLEGKGIHLGQQCRLTFKPAASRDGIRFVRTDLPDAAPVRASIQEVSSTDRATRLGQGLVAVLTVEHVLAAIAAHELDDVTVEMDGPEPPIFDGSAAPFFSAIKTAGTRDVAGDPDYLHLDEPVRIIDGDSVYEAFPSPSLELDVTIEFPHPRIGRQTSKFSVDAESFGRELASARTFGFVREVDELRKRGLIRGATLDTAIVLDDTDVVSGPLRWPDEFLRHKVLDCLGDLALAGARVRARVVAHKPSHRGTVTLVRELVRSGRRDNTNGSKSPAQGGRKFVYGIEDIMKVLPHRYPFLLVDRIIEIQEKQRIVGVKNVTINEPFFQGHFPGHPIMPGVLIIESMAQVGGMLLMGMVDEPESKVVYFMSLDDVKFRRPVKPGDQLRLELEVIQIRGKVCKMRGVAKVDDEVVAEADMAAMVRDR